MDGLWWHRAWEWTAAKSASSGEEELIDQKKDNTAYWKRAGRVGINAWMLLAVCTRTAPSGAVWGKGVHGIGYFTIM